MKFKTIYLLLLYLFFISPCTVTSLLGADKARDSTNFYLRLYDQLTSLKPDPEQYSHITNYSLKRDVAEFYLERGDWYFCKPVSGRVIAAVFSGKGIFRYTPPTQIEKDQLFRFYKKDSLNEKFNYLFILFADSTYHEFQKHFPMGVKRAGSKLMRVVENALKYMGRKKEKSFNDEVIKFLLEGDENDLFYAYFGKNVLEPMFFEINPYQEEEVRFMRRKTDDSVNNYTEVINQFHIGRDYQSGLDLSAENKAPIDILSNRIECDVKKDLDIKASAHIRFKSRVENQTYIKFFLFSKLKVDSVSGENGEKLQFFKGKENPRFWIALPAPMPAGETSQITIQYGGKLLKEENEWIFIQGPQTWYPTLSNRDTARFDLLFSIPEKYRFVSTGELISADTVDQIVKSHWKPDRPVRSVSFNIGYFKDYRIENDSLPPVTILMAESAHQFMANNNRLYSERNMDKKVGEDIAASLSFFKKVYGDYPVKKFYATEIPYIHGQAFPGLIHLSWLTFLQEDDEGENEIFRAHEVAHQWWGIGVDFKTYHDQWLSEGFAQFSGLWYFQQSVRKEKKFYNVLKEWRQAIISNRKFLFSSGQEAGPIWMGYRTQSSNTPGDYGLIIYRKSAWVLHMLRMMMMELPSKNDDHFIAMMRDVYQTYLFKKASTSDFQQIVEKHLGMKMDWFFRQWIYGTDIPTYKYSYQIIRTPVGIYTINLKVRQEDCTEDFRMPVIIKIEFGKDDMEYRRLWIDSAFNKFVLDGFVKKPRKLIFNDLESVLCKIKKERWKGKVKR